MGSDSNSIGKGQKAAVPQKTNVNDQVKEAVVEAAPVAINAARNYNELMMTSLLSVPDVAADAVVLNSMTPSHDTFPPPKVNAGPSLLNKALLKGSMGIGTVSVVYAANRLGTTGTQLADAYNAWHDPKIGPSEKYAATAAALDGASLTTGAVWSGSQVIEVGKDSVKKLAKAAVGSGGSKKATEEISKKAVQVTEKKVAEEVAKKGTEAVGKKAATEGLKEGAEAAGKKVATEVAKEGASFIAKRIIPGAAIATGALDIGSALAVIKNPDNSPGEKLGAAMQALGSASGAGATVALLAPEPVISKVTGLFMMGAGVVLSVGGAYISATSAASWEEAKAQEKH